MKNESTWTPVKSKRNGIVGYLEMFRTTQGGLVSIPGVSRWIDGPILNPQKAVSIE